MEWNVRNVELGTQASMIEQVEFPTLCALCVPKNSALDWKLKVRTWINARG